MKILGFNEILSLCIVAFVLITSIKDIYQVIKNNKDDSREKIAFPYVETIFNWIIAIIAISFVFFITPIHVSGESMEPSFHNNQWLLQNKIVKDYSVGDVVVFYAPKEDKYLIKRIVAVGGDKVEVKNSQLYVNDEKVDEQYNTIPFDYDFIAPRVPEGEYFVLGDNRPSSLDSRFESVGTIDPKYITGKIILN